LTKEEFLAQELDKFTVIVLLHQTLSYAVMFNQWCREFGVKFIYADCRGVFLRLFNDFGTFTVLDWDGEALKEIMIKSISENGDVEVLGNSKHDLMDGDKVALTEIKGMKLKQGHTHEFASDSINETIWEIKVLKPNIFNIGDVSNYEI